MAVERQTERMIGEQAGRVRPVASGLRVADRFDWLGVVGEPFRSQSVHPRYFGGHGPAQLQTQNLREELVVAKPRTFWVYRDDKCVCILQLEEKLLGAGVAGHQVGQFAVHLLKY